VHASQNKSDFFPPEHQSKELFLPMTVSIQHSQFGWCPEEADTLRILSQNEPQYRSNRAEVVVSEKKYRLN
jgi:hypothetical protein